MKRAALGLVLVAVALSAHATTMVPLDLRALTERADRVVLATVESQSSQWTAAHDTIFTEYSLRVTRSYKGGARVGDAVVVRTEGGVVEGIGARVYGAAGFAVGEEALVFVEQRGAASYVVGMAQGKLHVTTAADGTKRVASDLSQVSFIRGSGAPLRGPRALGDFERELRNVIRERSPQ